jgi:hypothetical protein
MGIQIRNLLTLDPESGIFPTLEPGWKNLDLASGLNIPGSATLL